jgi:hypothetical protein
MKQKLCIKQARKQPSTLLSDKIGYFIPLLQSFLPALESDFIEGLSPGYLWNGQYLE